MGSVAVDCPVGGCGLPTTFVRFEFEQSLLPVDKDPNIEIYAPVQRTVRVRCDVHGEVLATLPKMGHHITNNLARAKRQRAKRSRQKGTAPDPTEV